MDVDPLLKICGFAYFPLNKKCAFKAQNHPYAFAIWQPEINYKNVRGEGTKFNFWEHPKGMRPPPFFLIFESTQRTCDPTFLFLVSVRQNFELV
jgi:hypothetical protein